MVKLRNELVALYTVDSIRRIATECLVPMAGQIFSWDRDTLKKNAELRLKVLTSEAVRARTRIRHVLHHLFFQEKGFYLL